MFDVALPFSRRACSSQRRRRRTIIGCYYRTAEAAAIRPEAESEEPAQEHQEDSPTTKGGTIHPSRIAA